MIPHTLVHFKLPPKVCAIEDQNLRDHLGTWPHCTGKHGGDVTNSRSPSKLEVSHRAPVPLLPFIPLIIQLELHVWGLPPPQGCGVLIALSTQ